MEIDLLEGPMGLNNALMGLGLNWFLTSGCKAWTDGTASARLSSTLRPNG